MKNWKTTNRSGKRNELGCLGENLAADFLLQKGWEILGRNVLLGLGEADIIARDVDGVIVVVEVKTVESDSVYDPVFKLDGMKRRKLQRLAEIVSSKNPEKNVRVDYIGVVSGKGCEAAGYGLKDYKITHLENVLQW